MLWRSVVWVGWLQVRVTRFPLRLARRSVGGLGSSNDGGSGGPNWAQLARSRASAAVTAFARCTFMRKGQEYQRRCGSSPSHSHSYNHLQYVARQILVLYDFTQHLLYVGCVDYELLAFSLGSLEADFVQHALHDGVEAAGTDIFRALIHSKCETRHFIESIGSEFQLYAFSFQQRYILPGQRRLRFRQNADEVFHG